MLMKNLILLLFCHGYVETLDIVCDNPGWGAPTFLNPSNTYATMDSSCVSCINGKYAYKNYLPSTDYCINCPNAKFSFIPGHTTDLIPGNVACNDCLSPQSTGERVATKMYYSSTMCVCNAGYYLSVPLCSEGSDDGFGGGGGGGNFFRRLLVGAVSCDNCYPDNAGRDGSMCFQCPTAKYSTTTNSKYCLSCDIGKAQDGKVWDPTHGCVECVPPRVVNTYTSLCTCPPGSENIWNGDVFDGCSQCVAGKYSDIGLYTVGVNTNGICINCEYAHISEVGSTGCSQCPYGKFYMEDEITPAHEKHTINMCRTCQACGVGKYRKNCKFDDAGSCEICPPCDREDEMRVDCLSHSELNDAVGRCVPKSLVVQTPICPVNQSFNGVEVIESPGLNGFSFRELFGSYDQERVDFQCRETCVGVTRDTGVCGGPYACNTPACSMGYSQSGESLYRLARACPVKLSESQFQDPSLTDTDLHKRRSQQCRTCEECGLTSNVDELDDWGLGCAEECSRILCDAGEIYDFTDSTCKLCDQLSDSRLCSSFRVRELGLNNTDVSGNGLMVQMHKCQAKTGNSNAIDYGDCRKCESTIECSDGEYPASCSQCKQCVSRGFISTENGRFFDFETGEEKTAFCQLRPCTLPSQTGLNRDGKMCTSSCQDFDCAVEEFEVPCVFPHDKRCFPAFPAKPASQSKVAVLEPRVNFLEVEQDSTPQFFSSFENIFIPLQEDARFQCVWNAMNILDNSVFPAGISRYFRDAEDATDLYAGIGTKLCHPIGNQNLESGVTVWKRLPSIQYPMLPLQNTVLVSSGEPRRVYTNTSALVIHYDTRKMPANTDNNHYFATKPMPRPFPHLHAFSGDLYLELNLQRTWSAAVGVFVPRDREIQSIRSWPRSWMWSYHVAETTLGISPQEAAIKVERPDIQLSKYIEVDLVVNRSYNPGRTTSSEVMVETIDIESRSLFVSDYLRELYLSEELAHVYVHREALDGKFTTGIGTVSALDIPTQNIVHFTVLPYQLTNSLSGLQSGNVCKMYASGLFSLSCMQDQSLQTFYFQSNSEILDFIVLASTQVGQLNADILMLQTYHYSQGFQVALLVYPPAAVNNGAILNTGLDISNVYASFGRDEKLYTLYKKVQGNIVVFTVQTHACKVTPSADGISVALDLEQEKDLRRSTAFAFDEILRGFTSMSVHSSASLFVVSVVRKASDATINLFMAFVVNDVVIDDDVVANSELAEILGDQNTYDIECRISSVWQDSKTVIVGIPCYSVLYRVSFDSNHVLRHVKIKSDLLMGKYFEIYDTVFYLLQSEQARSIQSRALSKTCAYGYRHAHQQFSEGVEGKNVMFCAQECTADDVCVAYNIDGEICRKFEESRAPSDDAFAACTKSHSDFAESAWRSNVLIPGTRSPQTAVVLGGFQRLSPETTTYARTIVNFGDTIVSLNTSTILFCGKHGAQVSNIGENMQVAQNFLHSVGSYHACSSETISGEAWWYFNVNFPASGYALWLVLRNNHTIGHAEILIDDTSTQYRHRLSQQTSVLLSLQRSKSTSTCILQMFEGGSAFGLNTSSEETTFSCGALTFEMNSWVSVIYAQEHIAGDSSVHFRLTAVAQGLDLSQGPVELSGEWQHVRHFIRDDTLRRMSTDQIPLRVRFTRPLDHEKQNLGGVEDSVDLQRTVAIDNLQLLPLLNSEPAVLIDETRMFLFLDVPLPSDLELLNLKTIWRGSHTTWERLHMWVHIRDAQAVCSYTAHFKQVDEILTELNPQPTELHRLGCRLETDADGHASCALVMPVSSYSTIIHVLQISSEQMLCPLPHVMYGVYVSVEPYATIYECAENEFPDIDGVCRQCVSSEQQELLCGAGEYLESCAALKATAGEQLECKACPVPAHLAENSWEWNPSDKEPCRWQCKDTDAQQFFYDDKTCVRCSDSVTCNPGFQKDACSAFHDLQCIACEPLKHGTYTANEDYVPNSECTMQCNPGFYREQVGLVAPCLECDSFEIVSTLSLISRAPGEFKRFQQCTPLSPASAVNCRPPPAHATLVGDATSFDSDCTYKCEEGYRWIVDSERHVEANGEAKVANFTYYLDDSKFYENWQAVRENYKTISWYTGHCQECVIPTSMPADAIYKLDADCNVECTPPWVMTKQAPFHCILCDPALCEVGEYMACGECLAANESPCQKCKKCSLLTERRDDNWEFTSKGVVDGRHSCDFECKDGFFQSGLDCVQHSARPIDCTVDQNNYWFVGSSELDAMCLPCGSCEGQRLVAECSPNAPVQCESCGLPQRNEMFVGQSCETQCVPDTIRDLRYEFQECEYCVHVCQEGTHFTTDRMFCEDCRTCPDAIPDEARWLADCAWECPDFMEPREQGAEFICVHTGASAMHAHVAQATLQALCPPHQYLDANYHCRDCDTPTPPLRDKGVTWEWVQNSASCEWVCLGQHILYASSPTDMHCITWEQFNELVRTTLTHTTREFSEPFRRPRVQYERLSDFECALFVLVLVACMGVIARS